MACGHAPAGRGSSTTPIAARRPPWSSCGRRSTAGSPRCSCSTTAPPPTSPRLVDRSPAWSVIGAAPDIAPLVPLLRRRSFVDVRPWVVTAYPVTVTDVPHDSTRIAVRTDLDALVELYSTFEFVGGLTTWQLRARLRHVLDRHYIIVTEWPGDATRFAGAAAVTTRARRYAVLDLLTVVPEHRGAGRSWALVAHAQVDRQRTRPGGRRRPWPGTNPMNLEDHLGDDTYVAVRPRRTPAFPRAGPTAQALRPLAAAEPPSTDLVPRTGRTAGAQRRLTSGRERGGRHHGDRPVSCSRRWVSSSSRGRRRRGHQSSPSSAPSTLSRDSTAGRSYCISFPSAAGSLAARRRTHCSAERQRGFQVKLPLDDVDSCRFRHAAAVRPTFR